MRTTLSSTVLTTGPAQDLMVKDVYDVTGPSGNTAVRDVLAGIKDTTINALRSTPAMAEQLAALVAQAKTGQVSPDMIKQRLTSMVAGRGGLLDNMTGGLTRAITKGIGMSPALANQVLITVRAGVDGVVSGVNRVKDLYSTQNVINLMQTVLNDRGLVQATDLGAEAALLSGVLGEAVKLGIPQSVELMMQRASTEEVRRLIASQNIGAALYSGNLDTLESILSHVSHATLKASYPSWARDFLNHYTLQPTDKANDYPTIKDRMITLFVQVDPHWDSVLRNGAWMPSVASFVTASEDAKKVFLSSAPYRTAIVIASVYKPKDIKSWIKSNYPYYPH